MDREKRTVELSFLSEAPYTRSYGVEILDHSPGSIDLGWLNSGRAPFMVAPNGGGEAGHKGAIQIGSIVANSARVDADRKTRALVKVSRSPEGDSFLNDYDDDIAINISSGYRQGKPVVTKMGDGTATVRWMLVEPREVTRVPLPADESVGIGRSADDLVVLDEPTNKQTSEVNTLTAEETKAAELAATRAAELQRLDDIKALGTRFNMEAIATRCALENKSVDETRSALLAELNKTQDKTLTSDADRAGDSGKVEPIITIHQSVNSFTGARDDAAKKAYRFAAWFVGSVLGANRGFEGNRVVTRAQQYCKDQGIRLIRVEADRAGQVEGDNSLGGFLVPHEFNNDMIDLREKFGVFRRNIRIVPMASDTRSQPRRKGGLTAYVIGEGTGATESRKNWDRVGLSAKKIGALTRYSTEIAEDAFVSIGDDLASEIAYAFAQFEDTVGFVGNGGVNHARITGAVTTLQNQEDGDGAAGVVEATGNTWDEFELIDFLNVVGLLPESAETANVKWFCSKLFWATVIQRVKYETAGGNRTGDVEEAGRKSFLGYPVEVSQVLPKSPVNGKVQCLFGDLRLAGMMGDRRQTTIATSEHVHFEDEEIAVRGSERFDINIHDIGDDTDAGPLLGLKAKSS